MHGIGAWKTLCKRETLEQDFKNSKKIISICLEIIMFLDGDIRIGLDWAMQGMGARYHKKSL